MIYKLINRILFINSILLLIMCKTNIAQDKKYPEQIYDAYFTNWSGGIDGVRGINYEFTIISDRDIYIDKVIINNNEQNFRTDKIINGYKIFVYKSFVKSPPIIGEDINKTVSFENYDPNLPAYIEYKIENSTKTESIKLPKFTQKNTPLIP